MDQIVAFPLGKAYKHIKNGSDDSILFFYYMVLASANQIEEKDIWKFFRSERADFF